MEDAEDPMDLYTVIQVGGREGGREGGRTLYSIAPFALRELPSSVKRPPWSVLGLADEINVKHIFTTSVWRRAFLPVPVGLTWVLIVRVCVCACLRACVRARTYIIMCVCANPRVCVFVLV